MIDYILRNKIKVVLCLLTAAGSAVFIGLLPYITAEVVDNVNKIVEGKAINSVAYYVIAIMGILLFEYFDKVAAYRLMRTIMYQLRADMVSNILARPRSLYDKHDNGFYLSAIVEDTQTVYQDFFDCAIGLITGAIRTMVFLTYMIMLNWILAIVIMVVSVCALFVPQVASRKLSKLRSEQAMETSRYVKLVGELLNGHSVVNYRTRNAIFKTHDKECKSRELKEYIYNRFRSFVEIFAGFSLYAINIVAFAVGIALIQNGLLSVGSFVGLISFIDVIAIPIRDSIYQVIGIKSSKEIRRKIKDLLCTNERKKELEYLQNTITLNNVSAVVGDFIIDNINLTINKGKKYAVVGRSGAGKSTLLKMISGEYDNYSGEILVDEDKIVNADVSKVIAMISQDTQLFSGSVEDNITVFGSYSGKNLDIEAKAIDAQIIMRDNIEGDGSNVSGGEKAKIGILRALAMECDVILCDEMLASIDEKSRTKIEGYILNNAELTIISVTHDISRENLQKYDEIIIMDKGKVVNQGPAEQMVSFVHQYVGESK